MRLLALTLALAALPAMAAEYPLWNGEPIEEYAEKVGLPATRTLNLGDGVTMEFVLIPAGKFTMGTPKPVPVDEDHYITQIVIAKVILLTSIVLLIALGIAMIGRAARDGHRLQVSLAMLLVLAAVAGVGLVSGLHWHHTAWAFAEANNEYEVALARFKSSSQGEKPAHEVTLTRPFWIGKHEVTQEQYKQIMDDNWRRYRRRDLPMADLTWDKAYAFCERVSLKTEGTVRLPTEAEWEYACRAGTETAYHSGDLENDLDRAAWYYKNSGNRSHPVCQKAPNAWGVYDMHGNVWEWCADWYETYKGDAVVDPIGPAKGQNRVLRGGSWSDYLPTCYRSASRRMYGPDWLASDFGFRVVLPLSKTH